MGKNSHPHPLYLLGFRLTPKIPQTWGVTPNPLHFGFLLFKIRGGAGICPPSPNPRHEHSNTTSGIMPDFRASRGIMRGRVCQVGVLVGTTGSRYLVSESVSHIFIVFG